MVWRAYGIGYDGSEMIWAWDDPDLIKTWDDCYNMHDFLEISSEDVENSLKQVSEVSESLRLCTW